MADKYKLDVQSEAILEEYRRQRPVFEQMQATLPAQIRALFEEAGIVVASIESRIKEEASLAGKLELKGAKYASLGDITDVFGMRIITFYTDDVDKVASGVERIFDVDWENSVDKRKLLQVDSFGYLSLHYVCRVPEFPYRFEVQMRTILQHAWANMNHDTGYKSGVEVPEEYLRNMNRLAGMLELVDEQFSRIRSEINDYRRQVQSLVASGRLEEVPLDGDSYRSYLKLGPFDSLNRRIASLNQAEIQEVSLMPFLAVFKAMGLKTLGDVAGLIRDYSDAAYQIAAYQIGLTDLDILASSVGPQDLCLAFLLKKGSGRAGIRLMLDTLNGESESNDAMADIILEQAQDLSFMHSKSES
jgi:ppGpp synthetase/RelA/SpoT-type nucleotidyltranferase